MKMRKLIKAATALSLSVLLLASCSKPSDKPSDDDITSDKTTVQEKDHGKTQDLSSDKDDDTSSDVDLDGLWCNKYGPYVEIDTDAGTMVFVTGENFLIDKIEDDYIYVHWNDYDRTEYTIEQFMEREPLQKKMRCTYTSAANTNWYDGPISRQGDLRFPISLNGNKLSFLNTVLIPDEEFAKTIPDVKELITSFRFNDLLCETYSYYNLAIPVFKETGTCSFEPLSSGNLTYEIDGMTVTVTDNDNDESVKFYVLYKNEQPILTSEYGGVWYDDFSAWVGDYYEVFTDDIWTISSDRTLIISDGNQDTFYDWNSTDASLSFITEEQLSSNYSITYIADFHPHMYGSFRGSITENGSPFPDYYDLAMEGTFEYDLIEYRNEIREGTRSNDIYLTNQYVWKNGNETITVDVDLLGEDISKVWLPDYCSLSLQYHDHEEMFYNYHETCLSSLIHIRKGPYYNAVTITEELTDVDGDIDASLIGCRMDDEKTYGELFDFDSCSIIGDTLTVTCSPISAYDSYSIYISDEQVSSKVDRVFDIKAFLSTDPHDSPWGIDSSGYGCDVIDLVDMDYFSSDKCYIDPMNCTAIFYVWTPEDFACFTYYVNAVYISDMNKVHTELHLMNDIDLSGYVWSPLGENVPAYTGGEFYETSFCGVIYGNGYSIKNYEISFESSFLAEAEMFNVIGLTLENPVMGGANIIQGLDSYLFAGPSCGTGTLYDCHLKIRSEDYNNDTDELRFGDYTSIFTGFVDCTMTIDGEEVDMSGYGKAEFGSTANNPAEEFIQDDGSYKYDAQADYENFKEAYGI